MGSSPSEPSSNYLEKFTLLSSEDHSKDEKFWSDVILLSPKRNTIFPPPSLIYTIANDHPQNIVSFYTNSVKYLEYFTQSNLGEKLPDHFLDQVSFIFSMNNFILSVLFQSQSFHPILDSIMKEPISKVNFVNETLGSSDEGSNEQNNDQEVVFKPGGVSDEISERDKMSEIPRKVSDTDHDSKNLEKCSLFYRYLSCINNFLFMEGFTLDAKAKVWLETTESDEYFLVNRRDTVHTLFYCLNLPFFSKVANIPCYEMPAYIPRTQYERLALSLINYLDTYAVKCRSDTLSHCEFELIQNVIFLFSFALPSNVLQEELRFLSFESFKNCLTPIFDLYEENPISPLYQEFFTFFYVIAITIKGFARGMFESNLTPKFVFTLTQMIQYSCEILRESEFMEILLRTLLHIFSVPENIDAINIQYKHTLKTSYKAHKGTLCDLVCEILLNLINCKRYYRIILNIIWLTSRVNLSSHQCTRFISHAISLMPSDDIEALDVERKEEFDMILAIIANAILSNPRTNMCLLVALYDERKSFKALLKKHYRNEHLSAIVIFNKLVKERFKELASEVISTDAATNSIQGVDITLMFPGEVTIPEVKPGDDIDSFWLSWIVALFKKMAKIEISHLGV